MNKKLLFGMFLVAGVGTASAQNALNLNKEINKSSIKGIASTTPKAAGSVVWADDFNNTKTYDLAGTELSSVASAWVADNAGQTGSTYGWTTDAVKDSWANFSAFNFTNGGNYGEVSNGNPTTTPGTQVVGVVYTLTSPVINVASLAGNAQVMLQFEQTGAKFYEDQYVEVSTDGTTWTRVYDNAAKAMHSANSSNPYPNVELVQVDIESAISAAASTVQIRFGWTSIYPTNTNPNAWVTYGWFVDNVQIVTKPDVDLAYTYGDYHFTGYKYTQIPTAQISPVTFRAGVKNQGTTPLTNVTLTVTDGTTPVTSTPVGVAVASVDTLEADFTLPSTVGTYNIQRSLSLAETDDNPANNSGLTANSFAVSNYTYACDNNSNFTEYPLDGLVDQSQNPIVIRAVGNSFDIYSNQDIYGVDFRLFTGTTTNSEVYVELYEMDQNASSAADLWVGPLAESDIFTVTSAAQVSQIQKLAFNTPYTLETGKTYLALLRLVSGTVKIASSGESDSGQGWINIDNAQVWGTFTDIPVVRMNFDPSLSVKNNNELVSGVSVYPNPAADNAEVSFNLNAASDVTINVVDVNGKVVNSNVLKNLAVGANSTSLNVANLANGVYSVVIKSNDSTVTKKLVVR
ncbi:MAG: T9SS type A sorting domain-containing protein [Bacteroidia bacterium]|nr:MAG: T9SS type A sorting domain-containing protein [Bacteroidia bacterium]